MIAMSAKNGTTTDRRSPLAACGAVWNNRASDMGIWGIDMGQCHFELQVKSRFTRRWAQKYPGIKSGKQETRGRRSRPQEENRSLGWGWNPRGMGCWATCARRGVSPSVSAGASSVRARWGVRWRCLIYPGVGRLEGKNNWRWCWWGGL
jgi:hypothetical protein